MVRGRSAELRQRRGGGFIDRRTFFLPIAVLGLAVSAPLHAQTVPADGSTLPPLTIAPDPASAPEEVAQSDWTALDRRIALASTVDPSADGISLYGPSDGRRAKRPTYDPERYNTFGKRVGAVKWEFATVIALLTVANLPKDLDEGSSFHFHDEGLFGHDTDNVGVDKTDHAFNSYLYADIFYWRLKRKAGPGFQTALTAGVLSLAAEAYGEIYDGFEASSGWSMQDVMFDFAGAGFSVLRNSIPGLADKLDFRLLLTPNRHFYSYEGKEHYRQQKFLFALKLGGFETFQHTPLRFVDLEVGYYASGFTPREQARGDEPRRHPFIGVGLNVNELLFKHSDGWAGKAARSVLTYIQLPYTSARSE
jgi:uncharacterized protein YfiM (DUF2279 family)